MKILITLFINAQEVECTTINNSDSSVTVTCTPVQKVYPMSPQMHQEALKSYLDNLIKNPIITEDIPDV